MTLIQRISERNQTTERRFGKDFAEDNICPEPYPEPGRAIRNLVGRSLVTIYMRCQTRTLLDTLQAFLRIVGDFKSNERDVVSVRGTTFGIE